MINSVFSLVLAIIASHSKRADGNVGSGDAAAEFEALCKIVRLAAPTVTIPTAADTNWPAIEKIAKINMTVADKEWKQIFRKKGESKAYHDAPPPELKPNSDWQDKWPLWKAAVEAIDNGSEDVDVKEMQLDKLDEQQRTLLRPHIIPLAEAALALTKKLTTDTVGGDKLTAEEAATTLLDAVYGEHPKPKTIDFNKIFVAKPTSNGREAAFEFGNEAKKVRTIAATLACICYKDNSAGQTQVCKHEQDTTHNWTDASATMTAAHIDAILALCGAPTAEQLTSETIRDALQSIRTKITTKAADGYLGPSISACSGAAAAGTCVKISGYKDKADAKWQAIPWVKPLLILQQKLAIREKRIKEAEQIKNQLNVELAKAIATRYAVKHTQAVLTTTVQQQKKEVNQHTAGCHLKNKTIEECPEADCNYDSEKKECKPKETGTETPKAAETGNGATGVKSTEGCAKHGTDKQACENDKTGDKQNCAFRKGKEGEDDRDTEMCRNCSFIVNKKLALIAVAFVSLVKFLIL
uniref:Variant surface glycoprotein 360 n=1 Tax=Trypanosoma brucei TaxID=5691 RepID=M4SZW5_9TRYP|nr:variant surface glycoprotein 360 [Trypanosoma brucei]